jgi:FkbM family methyltransferase
VKVQRFLHNVVRLAQYWQGVGSAGKDNSAADRAVLGQLTRGGRSPVIFDVGANRGQFLQSALTQLASRQIVIHSFEPSSTAFSELRQRYGSQSRVTLNNLALGSEPAERSLYYDVPGSQLSSLYPRRVGHLGIPFTGRETVRVNTLDSYCAAAGVNRIDLLKLDAEGHELEILKGADQMFERGAIGLVSFEFGGCNIDSRTFVRDFFEFFASRRMKIGRLTVMGKCYHISQYDEGLEQFRTTCFLAMPGAP